MSTPKEMKFHYVKSNFFRVVYAEGVAGGISPKGGIQMTFFNERSAIPQLTVHEMTTNEQGMNKSGREIVDKRVSKEGIVRELETEIVMSIATAESFHKWLGGHIAKLKELKQASKSNVSS